jgi:hypothetical protein
MGTQEDKKRAIREGLKEANDGLLENAKKDTSDELWYGREYLKEKRAVREGYKEARQQKNSLRETGNDILDELTQGREPVETKAAYREAFRAAGVGGRSGGGGGGGGGGKETLVVIAIILALPLGLYIQWKQKHEAVAVVEQAVKTRAVAQNTSRNAKTVDEGPGTLRVSITARTKIGDESGLLRESGVLQYDPDAPEALDISAKWVGPLYESEKPLRISLLRNGVSVYDRVWKQNELEFTQYGLDVEITNRFQAGRYLLRASVEGVPLAEYSFTMQPKPFGTIMMSDGLFNGAPWRETKVLNHRPGSIQPIYFDVRVQGALPANGKPVYIALVHDGEYLFNYSYPVNEQDRHFMVKHEADFAAGAYTARLSDERGTQAEYSFAVQHPR